MKESSVKERMGPLRPRRILIKVNRISAWMLLIFMIIFILSGYAWTERIIMSLRLARYLYTQLDVYLMFFFLVHVLISTKFNLIRWGLGHERLVDLALLMIGVISFGLVLQI